METKNLFSSRIGFILAAAGSAVGLGNLWRFPYLAAKYGGGTFLLIYLVLAVTFGFTLMITEIAIGRKTGKSALYAFSTLHKKSGFIGILASIVPILILPYYCVIGGWVVKFAWTYLTGQGTAAAGDTYFTGFITSTGEPLFWLFFFVIFTTAVILLGVNKEVENVSKILMPILVVLAIIIAVFVATRSDFKGGVAYYLKPDLSRINLQGIIAASGQIFYSMSLAMGIMITYGSYTDKTTNIESSVRNIEIFDTLIAFLAGLMIVPAAIPSVEAAATSKPGPTLMFVTLPGVFEKMPAGHILGAAFFVLVLFAALTSSISLMETIVDIFVEKFKASRKKTTILVTIYTLIMAVPSSLGFGIWSNINIKGKSILDLFDFVSNNILMPIVAILTCVFVGYVIKPKAIEEEILVSSGRFKSKKLYTVVLKYIAPVLLVAICIASILDFIGIIKL